MARKHHAKIHATSHEAGGDDEISLAELSGQQITVPYNGNIATISESDTDKHFLDLATALGETRKIIEVHILAVRTSGSGAFGVYPNEGFNPVYPDTVWAYGGERIVIADGTQRLQYVQTHAGDAFTIRCFGYVVIA